MYKKCDQARFKEVWKSAKEVHTIFSVINVREADFLKLLLLWCTHQRSWFGYSIKSQWGVSALEILDYIISLFFGIHPPLIELQTFPVLLYTL